MIGKNKIKTVDPHFSANASDSKENIKPYEKRNTVLFHRYYYYSRIHKMPYDVTMKNLMQDFFISDKRISDLIAKNGDVIKNICTQSPDIKYLVKKFSNYSWTQPLTTNN